MVFEISSSTKIYYFIVVFSEMFHVLYPSYSTATGGADLDHVLGTETCSIPNTKLPCNTLITIATVNQKSFSFFSWSQNFVICTDPSHHRLTFALRVNASSQEIGHPTFFAHCILMPARIVSDANPLYPGHGRWDMRIELSLRKREFDAHNSIISVHKWNEESSFHLHTEIICWACSD